MNVELGIACLRKMAEQLFFNICKLEDSRLANAYVEDLPSRIKENISDSITFEPRGVVRNHGGEKRRFGIRASGASARRGQVRMKG